MKHGWLRELYRQWMVARGNQITPRSRAFRRNWGELLAAAGLDSAEDQKAALREAEQEESKGRIRLHKLRGRNYIVQKIELPLESEPWLLKLFNQQDAANLLKASLKELEIAEALEHERFPKLWKNWCSCLSATFRSGRNMRPLYWRSPGNVKSVLSLIYRFTSMEWLEGAMIREVSVTLGLGSKGLEKQRRLVEACLDQMFGRPMPFQSLGMVLTDSRSDLSGILTLHYANGESQVFDKLKAVFSLSLIDLERASHATTPASRLLTVENSKTTLRRLASTNMDDSTLLAACSFPTKALLRLLELLPQDFPIFHFGDTDPAGFHILSKLREESGRPVYPFLMKRRSAVENCPLSEYDQSLLPRLLIDPRLTDVSSALESMKETGCKGDFEQESLGLPDLKTWPFYSSPQEF